MSTPRLLGISGALRTGSTNTALLREAARLFGPCDFTLADIRMPLYDGDLEDAEGIPPEAQRLRDQIAQADAVLLSSPEYNGNISGVLKNALDWISRGKPNVLEAKPLALMSAAGGRSGGARTQLSVRTCLVAFRPRYALAPEVMIAGSRGAFDEDGRLKDERAVLGLTALMDGLRAML